MINATGVVKLPQSDLLCYQSPIIEITGQSSNKPNDGIINVSLNIKSQDGGTATTDSLTLDTTLLKDASVANSVEASYMVDNLYTMLEQLLVAVLQADNPETGFQIVSPKDIKL